MQCVVIVLVVLLYFLEATRCIDGEDLCGMDGQTYSSLCGLYEAGTLLGD